MTDTPKTVKTDWEFLRAQVDAQDALPALNRSCPIHKARTARTRLRAELEALRETERPEEYRKKI